MPSIVRIQPGQSVEDLPSLRLIHWRAMKTESNDVYLVGYSPETARGRVSTPVKSLDPLARTAVTTSGRVYILADPPGVEPTVMQLWQAWAEFYGVGRWHDVTDEIEGSLRAPTQH